MKYKVLLFQLGVAATLTTSSIWCAWPTHGAAYNQFSGGQPVASIDGDSLDGRAAEENDFEWRPHLNALANAFEGKRTTEQTTKNAEQRFLRTIARQQAQLDAREQAVTEREKGAVVWKQQQQAELEGALQARREELELQFQRNQQEAQDELSRDREELRRQRAAMERQAREVGSEHALKAQVHDEKTASLREMLAMMSKQLSALEEARNNNEAEEEDEQRASGEQNEFGGEQETHTGRRSRRQTSNRQAVLDALMHHARPLYDNAQEAQQATEEIRARQARELEVAHERAAAAEEQLRLRQLAEQQAEQLRGAEQNRKASERREMEARAANAERALQETRERADRLGQQLRANQEAEIAVRPVSGYEVESKDGEYDAPKTVVRRQEPVILSLPRTTASSSALHQAEEDDVFTPTKLVRSGDAGAKQANVRHARARRAEAQAQREAGVRAEQDKKRAEQNVKAEELTANYFARMGVGFTPAAEPVRAFSATPLKVEAPKSKKSAAQLEKEQLDAEFNARVAHFEAVAAVADAAVKEQQRLADVEKRARAEAEVRRARRNGTVAAPVAEAPKAAARQETDAEMALRLQEEEDIAKAIANSTQDASKPAAQNAPRADASRAADVKPAASSSSAVADAPKAKDGDNKPKAKRQGGTPQANFRNRKANN